jgi:uncharacterized delta-60 repeat protein
MKEDYSKVRKAKKGMVILLILILSVLGSINCKAATKSADINGDGRVDFNDFALLASHWLEYPNVCEEWVARYNGPANGWDEATAITTDNSGNIYVTGESWDSETWSSNCITIKYDPNGNQIWVKRYSGTVWCDSHGTDITADNSGNIYVTGYGLCAYTETLHDFITIKYDPNGNQIWEARYNGPGNSDDYANAMTIDSSGNIYITGYSTCSETGDDFATVKYDPNGNQLWEAWYSGPGGRCEEAKDITTDSSGNIYVGGDYATIKYDPNGNQLWIAEGHSAKAITTDSSGNIYITSGGGFYATIKYDPNGNQLWAAEYNGSADGLDLAFDVAVDTLGNAYVTGESYSSVTGYDYATVKYDPNGNQLWVARYSELGNDGAGHIITDNSGNIYVTGFSESSSTGSDYATIKYDPNGNQLWIVRYNNSSDAAYDITIDRLGNIYVTGVSSGLGTYFDSATIKYSQDCPCQTEITGDLDGDCRVDFSDLAIFVQQWLAEP